MLFKYQACWWFTFCPIALLLVLIGIGGSCGVLINNMEPEVSQDERWYHAPRRRFVLVFASLLRMAGQASTSCPACTRGTCADGQVM